MKSPTGRRTTSGFPLRPNFFNLFELDDFGAFLRCVDCCTLVGRSHSSSLFALTQQTICRRIHIESIWWTLFHAQPSKQRSNVCALLRSFEMCIIICEKQKKKKSKKNDLRARLKQFARIYLPFILFIHSFGFDSSVLLTEPHLQQFRFLIWRLRQPSKANSTFAFSALFPLTFSLSSDRDRIIDILWFQNNNVQSQVNWILWFKTINLHWNAQLASSLEINFFFYRS